MRRAKKRRRQNLGKIDDEKAVALVRRSFRPYSCPSSDKVGPESPRILSQHHCCCGARVAVRSKERYRLISLLTVVPFCAVPTQGKGEAGRCKDREGTARARNKVSSKRGIGERRFCDRRGRACVHRSRQYYINTSRFWSSRLTITQRRRFAHGKAPLKSTLFCP